MKFETLALPFSTSIYYGTHFYNFRISHNHICLMKEKYHHYAATCLLHPKEKAYNNDISCDHQPILHNVLQWEVWVLSLLPQTYDVRDMAKVKAANASN